MATDLARDLKRYELVRPAARAQQVPQFDNLQQRVIDHPGGPLRVLAGPGTGKTTLLVEAPIERITRRGVSPDTILLLTFSRRAAVDLRERITARLARTTREPLARTFHSYAFGLLRLQASLRGEPPPRLLSSPEQDLVIRELLHGDVDSDQSTVEWPRGLRSALFTRGFAEELRDLMLRAIERNISPDQLAHFGEQLDRPEWISAARFLAEYLEVTALSGSTALDPAELIRAAVDALRADAALLADERAMRQHIFVDEYQDTDPAQRELLQLLAQGANELIVVGDPDQSIYGFRGSDAGGLRRFADEFHSASRSPIPTVSLTNSYRGGQVMLDTARRFAVRLTGPAAHRDLISRKGAYAGTSEVHVFHSPADEASYVAHQLRAAHLLEKIPWSQMAVVVRSASLLSPLQRVLIGAGVPISCTGEGLALAAQPGVAPFILLLRCALRPTEFDEDSAVELLTSSLGGADALSLRRLRRHLRQLFVAAKKRRPAEDLLSTALQDAKTLAILPDSVAAPARRISRLLAVVREAAARREVTAEDVLWAAWAASGLGARWQAASAEGGVLGEAADRDLDSIVSLFSAAARFTDQLPRSGPEVFLDYLSGQQIPGDSVAVKASRGQAVRLVTAHATKGCQWQLVVVCGVQEGMWPNLTRRGSLLGTELLVDLAAGRDVRGISQASALLDEERRLFYVAITRAQRRLVVTAVHNEQRHPSRFLDELDPLPAGEVRRYTVVPRMLSFPCLVAELRSVVTDPTAAQARRYAAAAELARLAKAGVPGADPQEWWGLAPLSDARPLCLPHERVNVSPSQVEKFVDCELRWLLETAGGTAGNSVGQSIGVLIHDLAALTGDPHLATDEVLQSRLDEALSQMNLGGPWRVRKEREKAHRLLGKFLAWLAESRSRWELVGVEVPFSVSLGGRTAIRGRVDRLERDRKGRLVIVDLKTGQSLAREADMPSHPQLGAYQLAIELGGFSFVGEDSNGAALPEAAEDGSTDHALSHLSGGAALIQLGGSLKKYKEQYQQSLSEADEPQWARELVSSVAEGMAGTVFRAVPGKSCRVCPAQICCPAHVVGRQVTA